MALKICKECGREISETARRCPHCGNYIWSTGRIGCAVVLLFFFLMILITVCQK